MSVHIVEMSRGLEIDGPAEGARALSARLTADGLQAEITDSTGEWIHVAGDSAAEIEEYLRALGLAPAAGASALH